MKPDTKRPTIAGLINTMMHGVKQCPVTAGLPTTMSSESFDRMCQAYQKKAADSEYRWWCDECRGNLPDELTISDLCKKKGGGYVQETGWKSIV